MKKAIELPDQLPDFGSTAVFSNFQYAPAVIASGRLLFIAGQVGIAPDGSIPESAAEQAELAFSRLGVILGQAGLTFSDLVDLNTYHVRIEDTLAPVRAVKEKYITSDFPAWTIIGAHALARPMFLVEVKAVAVFRD